MNRPFLAALFSLMLIFSVTASAAKPTSITIESTNIHTDGSEYAVYVVVCSNNATYKLSAWDQRKKWCVGEGQSDDCERKQIKAAKKACR